MIDYTDLMFRNRVRKAGHDGRTRAVVVMAVNILVLLFAFPAFSLGVRPAAAAKKIDPRPTNPRSTKLRPTKPRPPTTRPTKLTTTIAPSAANAATKTTPVVSVPPSTIPSVSGTITVFAAASLTAAFTEVAAAFEKANPQAKVTLNFAGSSTLLTQLQNDAPADVFASADEANMDRAVNARLVDGEPQIFAKNRLIIVTGKGNPLRIKTLSDLSKPEVFVALGAPGVPVGDYARQVLAKANIDVKPKTLEANVSAIVNKVALREIDAGIVYVTDVAIDDYRVDGIPIPDSENLLATYPIAALSSSKNRVGALAMVAFAKSETAQSILAKYKFLPIK